MKANGCFGKFTVSISRFRVRFEGDFEGFVQGGSHLEGGIWGLSDLTLKSGQFMTQTHTKHSKSNQSWTPTPKTCAVTSSTHAPRSNPCNDCSLKNTR